ncbi:MBL fold metallo-hydrolase [uncultured Jatrophihabitans sp.]|uniref:MBL fold metallo-hydrolase n=1 Tax=uncultured Jatrophihabitans sp. TaxID=1610747 RepID=UPI0035C978F1
MNLRVDHTTTSGTFSLDGGTWDVENNVWVIGDHRACVVIDAPHDAGPIAGLIGDRMLLAILCTHAHDDHVTVARELSDRYAAPIYLHPADEPLWRMTYPDGEYYPLEDGQQIPVGDRQLDVLHTPGHSPGAVCYLSEDLGAVFTGDTLFAGGPGATGRSYSDFDTIVESIRGRLLTLPPDTVVHTGHGADTTIGAEAAGTDGWQRPD